MYDLGVIAVNAAILCGTLYGVYRLGRFIIRSAMRVMRGGRR